MAFVYVGGAESALTLNESSGAMTPLSLSIPQSGFGAADPSGRFLFVGSEGGVTVERVDGQTGALTTVSGSPFGGPFEGGGGGGTLAVDAQGQFVCVIQSSSTSFGQSGLASVLRVDPSTGALAPVPGSPFAVGPEPRSLAIHPSGFVYVVNTTFDGHDSVSGFRLDPTTGALTPLPGSPYATGNGPQAIALDPAGKFAFVATGEAGLDNNGVWAYAIDALSGSLRVVPGSPFAPSFLTAFGIVVDPSGRFVVFTSFDAASHEPLSLLPQGIVQALSINTSTGALTLVAATSPAGSAGAPAPTELRFDPSGRFLLVSDEVVSGSPVVGGVSTFSWDPSTGTLQSLAGSPQAATGGGGSLVTIPSRSTP